MNCSTCSCEFKPEQKRYPLKDGRTLCEPCAHAAVLAQDVTNIRAKVLSKESITAAERAVLEREAGKVADTGRPEYALKKADLARALEISKQRLNGHVKNPGFPTPTPQGYHVETCRAWLLENGMVDNTDDDYLEARRRKTVAEAELAEMKLQELKGRLLDADAVLAAVEQRAVAVRQKVLSLSYLSRAVQDEMLDEITKVTAEECARRGREVAEDAEVEEVKRNL